METAIDHIQTQNIHYDFVYINPGLENILQALGALKNRQKVLLVFENDLERNDRFVFIRTFPFHVFEIPALMRKFKILQSVIKLAPHLFQPQKVLYLNQYSKFAAPLADYFYKNTYQKKLQILNSKHLEQLAFIHKNYDKGIYFQEYKYNVPRLFIELLKHLQAEGGVVKVNFTVDVEKNRLTSPQTRETMTASNIIVCTAKKDTNYLFNTDMPPEFSVVYRDSTLAFRFTNHNKMVLGEPLNAVSKTIPEPSILALVKSLFQQEAEKLTAVEKEENLTWGVLKKLAAQIERPLDCTFEQTGLKDMHERCLEKFDLAKQTGISYAAFKIIFHRYGTGTDEITEDVYSLMNKSRDVRKIWNCAEKNYRKKHEWDN